MWTVVCQVCASTPFLCRRLHARWISRRVGPHPPALRACAPPTENKNTHPLQPLRRLFTTELCIYMCGPHKAGENWGYLLPVDWMSSRSPDNTAIRRIHEHSG